LAALTPVKGDSVDQKNTVLKFHDEYAGKKRIEYVTALRKDESLGLADIQTRVLQEFNLRVESDPKQVKAKGAYNRRFGTPETMR
jgi:hypothetical protein